jgi:diguanylate cyclase (GGDEF)-like protein
VDPVTGHYSEYRANSDYAGLGIPREGADFFADSLKECERVIYPEDLPKVQTLLNRENILEEVRKNGFYTFQYRLMINGAPRYVSFKAAQLQEHNSPVLVIGINDVDARVKRDQDYERKLTSARNKANLDVLTGVKNKAAYRSFSEHLSQQIAEGQSIEYAIVLCRVDNLAQVNAAQGRPAGDQLIQNVCAVVCDTFVHCPVFRVAGDQFAVIVRGDSLRKIKALSAEMAEAFRSSGLSVSHGVAKYDGTESAASVFARAERLCFGE